MSELTFGSEQGLCPELGCSHHPLGQTSAPLGASLGASAWERLQISQGLEENQQEPLLQAEKLHFCALRALMYHIQRLNANV